MSCFGAKLAPNLHARAPNVFRVRRGAGRLRDLHFWAEFGQVQGSWVLFLPRACPEPA
jgi:hypothetical protein